MSRPPAVFNEGLISALGGGGFDGNGGTVKLVHCGDLAIGIVSAGRLWIDEPLAGCL